MPGRATEIRPGGYRPHLDGLRALAVYLVVVFHGGIDRFAGGFIGVDVFFVLSGYLVTQLLLRDLAADGRISLARFYSRRARRLLPAASIVLVVTAVVFAWVGSPSEWDQAADAIRAAAIYLANWFYIGEAADYFADDVAASPVLHFWSLAIEEQFYVVWPLLLTGLYRVSRRAARPRRIMQVAVAGTAAASLLWALSLATDDLNRAYYGTDTRAYQLLAGALLALSPGVLAQVRRRIPALASDLVTIGAGAALLVAATSLVDLDPVQRGVVATLLTLVLVATLDARTDGDRRGLAQRALSLPPIVYLGRISYGTYLWHWLVIIVATRELELSSRATTVVAIVVATALASLSFELVEHPIRSWAIADRYRHVVAVSGLALGVLVGFVIVPAVFDAAEPREQVAGASTAAATALPADFDWKAVRDDVVKPATCTGATLDACVVTEGEGPTMMLVGDSHAAMFVPMLEATAEELDLRLVVAARPMCAWFDGLASIAAGPECAEEKAEWYGSVIEHFDPEVVVLSHQLLDDPRRPNTLSMPGVAIFEQDDPGYATAIEEMTVATVDQLRADGRRVVIIEPAPQPGEEHPLECLARGEDLNACRFVSPAGPGPEERFDRQLADADDEVWSLDLDRSICPYFPICDPVVDDLVVMADRTHITGTFSAHLGPTFTQFLLDNAIVDVT